ncbi:DAK2 domain-containing protein [Flexivirga sp. ID2601S]|uniref:DAK2 domain-containing protein n=1 Tax=Flexivirga aerilata TaxID=1656889 RepID=A0A849AKG5_9MICO|nr:DAK2 domain-containing protein [Flexivirga aerilata]NNG40317.1 DAK2 domain-containing protein [Flexivirga aerilata]
MPLAQLDLVALRRWVITARADLAAYAEALNRLNVFPVPDGDTGSNLLLTMSEAIDQLGTDGPGDLRDATATMARATLVAAHGNSGVILSQLARGVNEVVSQVEGDALDGHDLAAVLSRASQLARDGVSRPERGTMLTVAGAAASAAVSADSGGADLPGVVDAAVNGAGAALLRTRTEHEVLRRAGVVDAGGAGYLLVIEALQRVVRGEGGLAQRPAAEPEWLRISAQGSAVRNSDPAVLDGCDGHGVAGGPAYEVMFLLEESDAPRVATLKGTLDGLGDSLVVAGGPDLWSVHVHVDDVAAAVNAAVGAGRAHRFVITRFADDAAAGALVVLPLVASDGMAQAVRDAGFVPVQDATPAQLRSRLRDANALVLCGSPHLRELADDAAAGGAPHGAPDADRVQVVGTDAAQLLAALAVVVPDAGLQAAGAAARDALEGVRSLRVVSAVGDDDAMREVRDFVDGLPGDAELLTVVVGDPGPAAARLEAALRSAYPLVDVTVVDGGAGEPPLTIGVE